MLVGSNPGYYFELEIGKWLLRYWHVHEDWESSNDLLVAWLPRELGRAGSVVEHVQVRHHQPRALPRGRQAIPPVPDPARQGGRHEHHDLEDGGGPRPRVPLERRGAQDGLCQERQLGSPQAQRGADGAG